MGNLTNKEYDRFPDYITDSVGNLECIVDDDFNVVAETKKSYLSPMTLKEVAE